ncbi:MAG: STAS domain-containing protein [Piscinibacter sp.]|nr:STAS domain-containing protein [Piscinibacter sp.]
MLLLPATITMQESRDTVQLLSQALQSQQDGDVVVDASALTQFDTSALAVLLECQRLAGAWSKGFSVRQAPPKLTALAKLYGVDSLLFAA